MMAPITLAYKVYQTVYMGKMEITTQHNKVIYIIPRADIDGLVQGCSISSALETGLYRRYGFGRYPYYYNYWHSVIP